jgi:hypothetical protein
MGQGYSKQNANGNYCREKVEWNEGVERQRKVRKYIS